MAAAAQQMLIGTSGAVAAPVFVAVAKTGTNRVMYSNNGTSWTAAAAAEANTWESVAYSSSLNRFVAVSSDGTNRIMYSSNGITWASGTNPSASKSWYSVAWCGGTVAKFVAVSNGSGTNEAMYSSDGIAWTNFDTSWNGASGRRALAWSDDLAILVACSSGGTGWMSSTNGTSFTGRTGVTGQGSAVAWSPSLALFASVGSRLSNPIATSSTSGTSWTSRNMNNSGPWQDVCWSPAQGKFAAVTGNGGTQNINTSTNGTSWSFSDSGDSKTWRSICWSESVGLFVAVTDDTGNSSQVLTSPDAATGNWTVRGSAETNQWNCICASG